MTNLRKCHSISMFAVIALAFVCLVVGQATVAKVEKASINENADNSYVTSVPLPSAKGPSSGSQSVGLTETNADAVESRDFGAGMPLMKIKHNDPVAADGLPKAQGDDSSDPFIIGDETALPYTATGDVSGGTDAANPWPCLYGTDYCASDGFCGADQWYLFSPTVTMQIEITTCLGPDGDLAMLIYEDAGSGFAEYACFDDACGASGFMPAGIIDVTAGNDYLIVVDGGWGPGPYQLDISEFFDPIGDACATADYSDDEVCGERLERGCYETGGLLTSDYFHVLGGFDAASLDGFKLCGTLEQDMYTTGTVSAVQDADWYLFEYTGTDPVNVQVHIMCASPWVAVLGDLSDGACPTANWWGWGLPGFYDFTSDPVTFYGGEVFSFYCRANNAGPDCITDGEDMAGYFAEFIVVPLTPVDDCPLALEISGDTEGTPIVQDLCGFTTDGPLHPIYGEAYGVGYHGNAWFRWTCEESGEYTFSACNTPNVFDGTDYITYDLYMGAFNDGCPPDDYTELAFNDDGADCPGYEPSITFIAAEGLTYLITVASWEAYAGSGICGDVWLDITHTEIPLIADNCLDGPIQITEDKFNTFFNNLNATPDGPEPSTCNTGSFGGDIWFEVTAWETGYAFASFCDVNFDANMEVYVGGDCPSNANYKDAIRCNDDGCPQNTSPWPVGHGSYTSFPVVSGDHYMLRVGGWYSPPDYPLTVGGMGFGWYEFFIVADPAGSSPDNDFCVDVTPVALADGVADERTGNTFYMTRNDLDCDVDLFPPNLEPNVWEAFSVPSGVCMDVAADFFGTVDPHEGNGTRYAADPGEAVAWTGCACEGSFVGVASTIGCLQPNECVVTGGDFNNYHAWEMMPAGDYWFALNHTTAGTMGYQFDYMIHFTGTVITCEYCVAGANIGSCGVSGGSWINAVSLEEINTTATGCHGYEDFTAGTAANLYKGMPYSLVFTMGKVGLPTYTYDRAYVWIDWNQNSVFFDLGENYEPTRLAYDWTQPFTVPLDAVSPGMGASGQCRMRIRLGSTSNTSNAYCGTGATFGEVEDYVINAVDLECGDFDLSGTLDADDIAFLQAWYFGGGTAPDYWQRADIDGDGMVTLADLIALVDAAYHGGATNCM